VFPDLSESPEANLKTIMKVLFIRFQSAKQFSYPLGHSTILPTVPE